MYCDWLKELRKFALGTCVALVMSTGVSRAAENDAELRSLLEQQAKQIEELKQRLDAVAQDAGAKEGEPKPVAAPGLPNKIEIEEGALRKIVADYLKDNPGAGMPASVQTGYYPGQGFVIRSAPAPKYVKWEDESKIPFELRFRGRVQLDYYGYKVTDNLNHQTGTRYAPAVGDFSQLEVKRTRFVFFGTAFTPNLRYWLELDGNTRGLGGTQNNRIAVSTVPPGGSGLAAPGIGAAGSVIGNGVTVDHAVRLFSAYVAYDFHPDAKGEPFCEGENIYAPTYTLIAGKLKPFFGLEEYLGSGNQQMVEYSMANWYFDADDDNLLMGAGTQIRAMEDRFYLQALVTNGNESQFPNTQMDEFPGFNMGFWYDIGGNWNEERKRWDLYGDTLADLDYSTCPVFRVGGAINFVWMDRRSIYGDVEQSRVRVMPAGPGGTSLIGLLAGDGLTLANQGAHAVDRFDSYSYNVFAGGKYRGFSLYNEWWFRNLDHFETTPNGGNRILYSSNISSPVAGTAIGTSTAALFNRGGLFDYGTTVQGGYFIIPKKLEIVGRMSRVWGQSGDVNGNGRTASVVLVPNVGVAGSTPVRVIDGAFHNFHEATEWAGGFNYYFKRNFLKWSTDVSWYHGGNPAAGGASPAGFIAGVDGWLLRTQLQLWF